MTGRHFLTWPIWALRALLSALVLTGLFPRMRGDIELEILQRALPIEEDGVQGWWCGATQGGVC